MRIKYRIKVTYRNKYYNSVDGDEFLKEFEFIKNGMKNGEYKKWDGGTKWIHCYYKNNRLNGEYFDYFVDGEIYQHSLYKNGKIIKEMQYEIKI